MNKSNALDFIEPVGESFVPVSQDEINQIEARLKKKLPDDYRSFIRKFGRSGFSGDAFIGPSVVFEFLGGGEDTASLLKAIDHYEDLTAEGMLVIADDSAGNPFVMELSTEQISFVDYKPTGPVAEHVADNFSDFIDKIVVKPY